jgi:ribosomal protein L32
MPQLITVQASDGSKLIAFQTSELEDCDNCGGKTFPGHACD